MAQGAFGSSRETLWRQSHPVDWRRLMKTTQNLKLSILTGVFLAVASPAQADAGAIRVFSTQESFDDVFFNVENAIVDRGYVIDYVAHIGKMLKRTAADVGAMKTIYLDARTLQFCSAVLSRNTMEADPANIAYCPYAIFVFERADAPGTVHVGFRPLPADASEESREALSAVNRLLEEISIEATGVAASEAQ